MNHTVVKFCINFPVGVTNGGNFAISSDNRGRVEIFAKAKQQCKSRQGVGNKVRLNKSYVKKYQLLKQFSNVWKCCSVFLSVRHIISLSSALGLKCHRWVFETWPLDRFHDLWKRSFIPNLLLKQNVSLLFGLLYNFIFFFKINIFNALIILR